MEIMENSHSKRLLQYQSQVDALVEDYKAALTGEVPVLHLDTSKPLVFLILLILCFLDLVSAARSLCDAKQLAFEIRSLETSMSTMLLPHFEICRTITTACVRSTSYHRALTGL